MSGNECDETKHANSMEDNNYRRLKWIRTAAIFLVICGTVSGCT